MLGDIFDKLLEDDHKLPYALTGTVINNFNPLKPASVQVMIPERTLGMNVTAWARVAMPFAAGGSGAYSLPDIGDEVVMVFCNGEIDSPLVIGSLYGTLSTPPATAINPLNTVKCVKTRVGNTITLNDTPGQMGIGLTTPLNLAIKMEDTSMSITLQDATSQAMVKIDGQQSKLGLKGLQGVTIESGACKISLDGAGQSVKIDAPMVTVEGKQSLTLKGAQIKLEGQLVTIEGKGQLDVKSSGITNVKGSMVKIN